ncbi:uncharacterized protein [Littorina saxatilis]|uniref:uncharacterized protein n=1 Tax=Littorina saxatilis TaxID=31220 RepID=UPI0038B55E0B
MLLPVSDKACAQRMMKQDFTGLMLSVSDKACAQIMMKQDFTAMLLSVSDEPSAQTMMKQDYVVTRARVQLTNTVLPLALLALLLVASGRSQAYVEVVSPASNEYQAVTPPAHVNVSALSRLCFSVTICDNAHVLLASSATPCATGDPQYEIVIGGWSNTRSAIRAACQDDDVLVKVDPGPLSCDEFRSFYVSWGEGVVRVVGVEEEEGGSVTQHVTMEHYGTIVVPVNFVFVAGWEKAGLWRVDFTCQVLGDALTTASSNGTTTASPTGDTIETSEASTSSTDFTPQTTESTSETTESTSKTTDSTPQTTESTLHTTKSTSPTTQSTSNTVQSTNLTTEMTGSASYSTTEKSTGSTSNPFPCHCLCASNATLAPDGEGDRAGLSRLLIAPNSTSMARRRRTSAVDGRVSSTSIGVTGVICVVVPFVLLIFSDITDVVRWVNSKHRRHN